MGKRSTCLITYCLALKFGYADGDRFPFYLLSCLCVSVCPSLSNSTHAREDLGFLLILTLRTHKHWNVLSQGYFYASKLHPRRGAFHFVSSSPASSWFMSPSLDKRLSIASIASIIDRIVMRAPWVSRTIVVDN